MAVARRAGWGLWRRDRRLSGVDGDIEPGDEPVAQIAGWLLAQGCLANQGARRGRDVVALVVGILQDLRCGRPVALVDQPPVELGRKRCPLFCGCLCSEAASAPDVLRSAAATLQLGQPARSD